MWCWPRISAERHNGVAELVKFMVFIASLTCLSHSPAHVSAFKSLHAPVHKFTHTFVACTAGLTFSLQSCCVQVSTQVYAHVYTHTYHNLHISVHGQCRRTHLYTDLIFLLCSFFLTHDLFRNTHARTQMHTAPHCHRPSSGQSGQRQDGNDKCING